MHLFYQNLNNPYIFPCVVFDKAFHRTFLNPVDRHIKFLRCRFQYVRITGRHFTNETYRIFFVVVQEHIPRKEVAQVLHDQGVYIAIVRIIRQEVRRHRQEPVGKRPVVDILHDDLRVEVVFFAEFIGDILRGEAFQHVG